MDYALKFNQICKHYRLSIRAFSRQTEIAAVHNYTGKEGKRRSVPSADIIGKILRAFPDISPYWLLLDEGPMIMPAAPVHEVKDAQEPYGSDKELTKKYLLVLEDLNRCQRELIECMKSNKITQ